MMVANMSLCPTPLTPTCEKEVQRLVGLVPDADLSALAATDPLFQKGGFRASCTSALRTRVAQLVNGPQPVGDGLRRLLARRSRARTLTGLLSPAVLSETRHALAALLGSDVLLVALLLDERSDVRQKAENWLQSPTPFVGMPPEDAHKQLGETFSDLAELLGTAVSADVPVTRETWKAQKEQLELRIRDLQDEKRRLKGVDDRLANVLHKLAETERALSEAREKVEATEKTLRQTARERDELKTETARETAHRDDRLAAAVDLALAHEFYGWLAQARATEAAAKDAAPHADLLARAEAALKKQRGIDRHSGNRAVLNERLVRLEQTLESVRDALNNALRPLPELRASEAELAAEITSVKTTLNRSDEASPLETALVARIHAAEDNELPHLRGLPDLIAGLHVLDAEAIERLRLAFQRRLSAAQAAGVPPDPKTEERQNAVSRLGRALAGQMPAILLLDGHNVLFGLPARYSPPRGGALSDADKRKKLSDDLVRLAAPCPTLRAWLVFDGPTRTDAQAAGNVRVTYSGGTGEHRADGVILDNLRFFKTSSPETDVFLVSNDNELCGAARRLGAQTVPVLDFGAFL
jgi:predicted  nucleic acid-binding Zn-ribbon protein